MRKICQSDLLFGVGEGGRTYIQIKGGQIKGTQKERSAPSFFDSQSIPKKAQRVFSDADVDYLSWIFVFKVEKDTRPVVDLPCPVR